jgi:hypothetical protein
MSDDVDTLDKAVFFKERTEHVFPCRKTQIPDEDLLHTVGSICDRYSKLQGRSTTEDLTRREGGVAIDHQEHILGGLRAQ